MPERFWGVDSGTWRRGNEQSSQCGGGAGVPCDEPPCSWTLECCYSQAPRPRSCSAGFFLRTSCESHNNDSRVLTHPLPHLSSNRSNMGPTISSARPHRLIVHLTGTVKVANKMPKARDGWAVIELVSWLFVAMTSFQSIYFFYIRKTNHTKNVSQKTNTK